MSVPNTPGGRGKKANPGLAIPSRLGSRLMKASVISGSGNQSLANRSMLGTSRRSISMHGDSKVLDKALLLGRKLSVQVFDEKRKDVTPRPLFQPEIGAIQPKQSKLFAVQDSISSISASEILSSISLQQTGFNASFAGPFTRSTFGGSSISKSSRDAESMTEEIEEPSARRDIALSLSDVQLKREELREQMTEEDLDKVVDVCLTSTETLWFLDMPAKLVSTDSAEAELVTLRNQTYTEVCKDRGSIDRYIERMTQTFNGAPKSKEVQCEKIILEDKGVMATAWDLYDSFNAVEDPVATELEKTSRPTSVTSSKLSISRGTMSLTSMGRGDSCASSFTDMESMRLARIADVTEQDVDEILKTEKFQQDLFFMERILVENIFQLKLAAYRQLPVIIDPDVGDQDKVIAADTKSPSLDRLWSFICEMTKGHNVSSLSWNKKNPDLLAVGYGQFGFKEQKGGLACCWSLKNTMWPERVFHCESGVTALDFSALNPNLLAVGMYNGTVAIYNVQHIDDATILDSSDNPNKHTSPVWQLKWIEQEKGTLGEDKGEILVSICADGRITKWHIRKGLDCNDLMKLKRTGSEKSKKSTGEKEKKMEAFISRQAPGMCFDFMPKDSNIYLAGTEEGLIHKCSCSYNEQFLDTYRAHMGPIYKVAWSSFCPDVFLSCSADWCIHLWRQDILKPILTFYSTTTAVYDIMWSPTSALVFGAVNEHRVEIWDLGVNILDPVIVSTANPGVTLTTLLFAKNTDCVLIGDSDGQVSVYELRNISSANVSEVDVLCDIIGATLASQL
ncbi:dynein axonemal intermediate chain 4 isoform X2 [Ascaphus truei]|uniref:dynein axonemal intermediate chain 4 isoform X2 n=1 Tax=Ascaphus truei TaxID=8439 RepID=UPI003F5A703B